MNFALLAMILCSAALPDLPQKDAAEAGTPIPMILVLDIEPLVPVWLREGGSGESFRYKEHQARILALQDSVARRLATLEQPVPELFRVSNLLSGVAVQAPEALAGRLALIPGVGSVQPLPVVKKSNSRVLEYLDLPLVWSSQRPALTGRNVRIGIIDTGIDYTHLDFGGQGLEAHLANDPAILGDVEFPTSKVVGGYDFAGTEYTGPGATAFSGNLPVPDPDPMDFDGHGTHVAGTAAGFGVLDDGTTWTGPWNLSLVPDRFLIGPGQAPEADLYAYKIFGDVDGDTESALTLQAMDRCADPNNDGDLSDHMDVINLSLGSSYGQGGGFRREAIANAAALGMSVVAAAGNDGGVHFITSDPCADPEVTCVASCQHDGVTQPALRILQPKAVEGLHVAVPAGFGPPIPAQGISAGVTIADPFSGCAPIQTQVRGSILMLRRGGCLFVEKIRNAQAAGASGVLVIYDEPGIPMTMGLPDDDDAGDISIPSVMIRQDLGLQLHNILSSGQGVQVLLSPDLEVPIPDLAGQLAPSSSRGPTRFGDHLILKPDLTAPGRGLFSAEAGSGWRGTYKSGTSMATPVVSGVTALVRQLHPDWTTRQIKNALVNTCLPEVHPNNETAAAATVAGGAGRINPSAILSLPLLARSHDFPDEAGVTFQTFEVSQVTSEYREVELENLTNHALHPELTLDVDLPPGTTLEILSPPASIPAGETATFTLKLTMNPAQMAQSPDPWKSQWNSELGVAGNTMTELSGLVVIQADAQTMILPLYGAMRPASNMGTTLKSVELEASEGKLEVPLEGIGLAIPGNSARMQQGVYSMVTPMTLLWSNPDGTVPGMDRDGLPPPPPQDVETIVNCADIREIGAASDCSRILSRGGVAEDCTLFLAISTHARWSTPAEFTIYITYDTNQDGNADGILYTAATGDVFHLKAFSLAEEEPLKWGRLNYVQPDETYVPIFLTDVMLIPLPLRHLGLSQNQSRLNFSVETTHNLYSGSVPQISRSPELSFDPLHSAFDFVSDMDGIPWTWDLPGNTLELTYNQKGLRGQGLLLVHHHNMVGSTTEIIQVQGNGCWSDRDCPPSNPVCRPDDGKCVECLDPLNCGPGQVCRDLVCLDQCASKEANPCPEGNWCSPAGACGDCLGDAGCPEGLHCQAEVLMCVQCTSNFHCEPGEKCEIDSGACLKDCNLAGARPCPLVCSPQTGGCVACLSDRDCEHGQACLSGTCVQVPGPLLSVEARLPAGEQCPSGGTETRSGWDLNSDGSLEPSEMIFVHIECEPEALVVEAPDEAESRAQGCRSGLSPRCSGLPLLILLMLQLALFSRLKKARNQTIER